VVWLGFLAGLVYFGGTVYWVVGVMRTYGNFGWPGAVLIGAGMAAYLSIFPAVFALVLNRSVRAFGVTGVWLAPCFWIASEWARSTVGFAFPWVLLGTSQARVPPVIQLASVTGVYGVSGLVALVGTAAAMVALTRQRIHLWGVGAVSGVLGVVVLGGALRVAGGDLANAGTPVRVGLVQGGVEQDAKWNPALRDPILQRHLDLSRRALGMGASLVIWPESSTPFYFDVESALAEPVRRLAGESHTPFLIGTDEFERQGAGDRYYNAVVLVGPDGRSVGSYRKMQLVPFGEYVPLKRALFFVGPLVEAVSDFSPGAEAHVFDVNGHHVSVSICYESVYPWISRAFTQRGSELLATITNDAWFGRSSAAYQHFDQGAVRAVEEGRFVVRAANTGISGAVDPYGRVLATTPLFTPTAIVVDVRWLSGRTIYGRAGDVAVWLSLVVTAWALFASWRIRRGRRPSYL
jgi:apolipoprotein N-acyltransferase